MPKALIWGESLVGSGHARVQSELARALQEKGWDVTVVTSSKSFVDQFDFGNARMVYQPPLKLSSPDADPYNMNNLLSPNGVPFQQDEEYTKARTDRLLDLYEELQPDAVITEMWPYARANFDFELIPLAEAVRANSIQKSPPTRMYSIARDIMFPPSQSSMDSNNLAENRHELAQRYFQPHSILARGDQNLMPLEESIGAIPDEVRDNIDYVGYFAAQPQPRNPTIPDSEREVLVTSGGGITADSVMLYEQSIRARKHSELSERTWRILVPLGCSEEKFVELQKLAAEESPDGKIVVERNRKDFANLLADASLLICHGGNTIIEAVSSKVPVLVVPRGLAKNNREQQIRAEAYYKKGLIELLPLSGIQDERNFSDKMNAAIHLTPSEATVQYGGAARMAQRLTLNHEQELSAHSPLQEVIRFESQGRIVEHIPSVLQPAPSYVAAVSQELPHNPLGIG